MLSVGWVLWGWLESLGGRRRARVASPRQVALTTHSVQPPAASVPAALQPTLPAIPSLLPPQSLPHQRTCPRCMTPARAWRLWGPMRTSRGRWAARPLPRRSRWAGLHLSPAAVGCHSQLAEAVSSVVPWAICQLACAPPALGSAPCLQTVPETPSPDVLTVNKPDHLRRAAMAAAGVRKGLLRSCAASAGMVSVHWAGLCSSGQGGAVVDFSVSAGPTAARNAQRDATWTRIRQPRGGWPRWRALQAPCHRRPPPLEARTSTCATR